MENAATSDTDPNKKFDYDFNVRLHDSNIANEEIYKQLELVDMQSAKQIHPNDRRKACRLGHGKNNSNINKKV